jgi:hypothetical protein
MIKIFDNQYYIDIDKVDELVTIPNTASTEQHISIAKYEMVKLLLEVVLSEEEEIDETLGVKKMSIPFKLAFNSLLNKKIINKY